jgi:Kinetochore protein Mis14 like
MEPFDADLLARVQALHSEIEEKTLAVTSLRRSTPLEAASVFKRSSEMTLDASTDGPLADMSDIAPVEIAREQDVKETYNQGMKLLKELKKGVPATTAKVERAKEVVATVYS